MDYLLKTDRTAPAAALDEAQARAVLMRGRHEGRKLVEVFVLNVDGAIDRFQERTRRRLGSNAIASRTWLCETADGDEWVNGRYIPEPIDAIGELDPPPVAVVLILQGAESAPETTVEQLRGVASAS